MVIFLCLQFWCGEWNWGPGRPGGNQSVQQAAVTEPSAAQGLLPVPPRQRLRLVTQVYVPPFLRTEWRVSTATIILTSINFSLFKNVFTSQQICKKKKIQRVVMLYQEVWKFWLADSRTFWSDPCHFSTCISNYLIVFSTFPYIP